MLLLVMLFLACKDDPSAPADSDSGAFLPQVDEDGDGFSAEEDCDDSEPRIYPGAAETCDGVDSDCDGEIDEDAEDVSPQGYLDADGDGFGAGELLSACSRDPSWSLIDGDCDDGDGAIHPSALETCDGLDNDCDNLIDADDPSLDTTEAWTVYEDLDGDSYGDASTAAVVCEPEADQAFRDGDCDDSSAEVYPGADEICGDGLDNNCDGDGAPCELQDGSLAGADARLLGNPAGEWAGNMVGPLGDMNGDGYDDIFVSSAYEASVAIGMLHVVYGPVSGDVLLSTTQAHISGDPSLGAWLFGDQASGLRDINGDDVGDIVITDVRGTTIGANAGGAWVFYGPFSGDLTLSDDADATIWADDAGDYFGAVAADLGDLNADGLSELAVGGILGGPSGEGGCFIFEGPVAGDLVASDADTVLYGSAKGDGAGYLCESIDDTNGDGVKDIVVGSLVADGYSGVAWLFEGPVSGQIDLASAHARFLTGPQENLGSSLIAEDLDGDGDTDLLLGAPLASHTSSYAGAVYGFYSPQSGDVYSSVADFRLDGLGFEDYIGSTLDAADLNQDGATDLLLGAPGMQVTSTYDGGAYLLMGPLGASVDMSAAAYTWTAQGGGHFAGQSVSIPGDMDGDGWDDLVIGAPFYWDSQIRGAAYVYRGLFP